MDRENDILNMLKSIPPEKCPEGFTARVINRSGILPKSRVDRSGNTGAGHLPLYKIGCIALSLLMAISGYLNLKREDPGTQDRIGRNTVA